MYTLVMNLPANELARNQFATNVKRGIERNPSLVRRILGDTQPVRYKDPESGEVHESIAVNADKGRLNNAFDHICRALYFHETGTQLTQSVRTLCNFLISLDPETAEKANDGIADTVQEGERLLEDAEEKGANQPVFSYRFALAPGTGQALILLRFYGGLKVVGATE